MGYSEDLVAHVYDASPCSRSHRSCTRALPHFKVPGILLEVFCIISPQNAYQLLEMHIANLGLFANSKSSNWAYP